MNDPKHDKKRQEALKAIDRVQAESETIADSTFARMAHRAQDHLGAADKDPDDQIEVWGTRIGRVAGLIFAIGLVIYLVTTYL
ncbi:hypothetical protein JM93_03856 [Roseibium hamelinense]|uniref:Uncharacterized protein n=1 Tax=Roseibium hamelinense TaxID=150831 RepID=A0A562SLQ6_9HYPH|nr:hypothetical protein [Roseibium hamelinense]MTI43435.1 hypothetical protein [Roseibium hamelinense]TWI81894.1 hypothetical protein JM93_03856 [Roseibium hamelinense]